MNASSPVAQPVDQTRIASPCWAATIPSTGCDVVPRLWIPEEARDVDQDRVEELFVFVRVQLRERAVLVVALRTDRLQPPVDAP